MMKYVALVMGACFTAILFLNSSAFACTDIRMTAKDGTVLVTRSMEYTLDLKANLRTSPRGRLFKTTAPDGNPGLSWKAKYGYIFLDALNVDIATDGMNEQGLSFEALYLPGLAQYQTVPPGRNSLALPYLNFGDWVLSNFKTVDEVRKAINDLYVCNQKMPGMDDTIFPLHFSVYDATGEGIVIEYVAGKLQVYDNKIGVMTNSPTYGWHLVNLNNYVHLSPVNPPAVMAEGVKFAATGQGFGMIGLPGDISPPSRFVKMAVLLNIALPADDSAGLLNLAEHLINNVDIPLGIAREPESGKFINELTQWVVFKDLTHKIFYYRTYGDLSIRAVSLAKINFSENAARLKMPIASKELIQDISEQFLKSKD